MDSRDFERDLRRRTQWTISCVAVLCIFMTIATPGVSAQDRGIRLVSTPWAPFTGIPGEARVALDLVHAALERIGITASTTIVEESEFTPSLIEGEFDGSAAVWRDAEREAVLLFSVPYLENRLILVGRSGADVSPTSFAGLAGRRIALVEGYSYGDTVTTGPDQPDWIRTGSEEDSLRRLLDGEVDYALMDEYVVNYIVKNHADEARTRLAFGSTSLVTRPLHLAIQRDFPEAESIIGRFNSELTRMIADGSYHAFLQTDWLIADVDGDGLSEYVPASDQAGVDPPERAYRIVAPGAGAESPRDENGRFYFGGRVYRGWSAVPEQYKVPPPFDPAAGGTTITLFSFTW